MSGSMGTTPGVMRELNRALVLDIVKREGPLSRAHLAQQSRLAKPTVSAIVEDLIRAELIHETGVGPPGQAGGRRPILLTFNSRSQFAVGVHIGVTTTTAVLSDGLGHTIGRDQAPTPHHDPQLALDVVRDLVKRLLRRSRVTHKRVVGLGVSVPGLVDPTSGVCLLAPNLGWEEHPIVEPLTRALGFPVFVHNVVQSIAVAEQWEGAARDARTVLVFYEDNGIGAALLVDGKVFHGSSGIAGEVGHLRMPGQTAPCDCGGRGCLEALYSGRAVARRAADLTEFTIEDGPAVRGFFAQLASTTDAGVQDLLRQAGTELGLVASWLLNLYNPDVLVLAGGFLEAGDVLLGPLKATALDSALRHASAGVDIRTSSLGVDAPVRGSVLLALQASDRSFRLAFGVANSR